MKLLLYTLIILISSTFLKSQTFDIIPYITKRIDDASISLPLDGKYSSFKSIPINIKSNVSLENASTYTVNNGDFFASIYRVGTSGKSIYDLQSNGSPMQIWQERSRPQYIHAVYMVSPFEDTYSSFPLRRTRYYTSTDYGSSWQEVNEIPNNIRSGYPVVTGLANGRVVIANHYISGPPVVRTFVHIQQFPQINSFITLNPGLGSTGQVEWPRIVVNDDAGSNVKINLLSGSIDNDSSFYNHGTSLNTNQFGNWSFYPALSDEAYSIARSEGGKVGVAFVNNDAKFPVDKGDVFFMESTNEGISFQQPVKIFDASLASSGSKGLGGFRGVSLVYSNEQPRVVFETVYHEVGIGYFPGIASNIRYWSPTLPGNNPNKSRVIVDSTDVPFYLRGGVGDNLAGICRPVIGKSDDDNILFVAMMVSDSAMGGVSVPTSFTNIFLTLSADKGVTWKAPVQITPSAPRKDWTYVSISPTNNQNGTQYFANLIVQSDAIPGSYISGNTNGKSLAEQQFIRVAVDRPVAISNQTNTLPEKFYLYQNYPNPFNPETKINFDLPERSRIMLKIFNSQGRQIYTLVENQDFAPGSYSFLFNGSGLSSGIYFYTLSTEKFKISRKMMFLK